MRTLEEGRSEALLAAAEFLYSEVHFIPEFTIVVESSTVLVFLGILWWYVHSTGLGICVSIMATSPAGNARMCLVPRRYLGERAPLFHRNDKDTPRQIP